MSTNPVGATATSSQGPRPAAHAFDGDTATFWVSRAPPSPSTPQVLTVVYASPRWVDRVTVAGRKAPSTYYGPKNYRVEGLVNGSWQLLAVVRDTTRAPRTTSVTRTSVTGLRLVTTSSWHIGVADSTNLQVQELTGTDG